MGHPRTAGRSLEFTYIFLNLEGKKGVVLKSYKSASSVLSTSSAFENYSGMEMETSHLCVWHFRESDIIKPVFSDPMGGQNNLYVMDFILYWECFPSHHTTGRLFLFLPRWNGMFVPYHYEVTMRYSSYAFQGCVQWGTLFTFWTLLLLEPPR